MYNCITVGKPRGNNRMDGKEVRVAARVPATLKDLMRRYILRDTHLNESDFIREAIREKIQREAPELLREIFAAGKQEASQ